MIQNYNSTASTITIIFYCTFTNNYIFNCILKLNIYKLYIYKLYIFIYFTNNHMLSCKRLMYILKKIYYNFYSILWVFLLFWSSKKLLN